MLTAYCYQNCSTCRNALKWLGQHGVAHEVKPIRETPPTREELQAALDHFGGDLRRLFNTSGMDYRTLGLKDRLPAMSPDEAFDLLTQNGNLVKRPFVVGNGINLAGFKADEWEKALLVK
jgi:arsenate reductase